MLIQIDSLAYEELKRHSTDPPLIHEVMVHDREDGVDWYMIYVDRRESHHPYKAPESSNRLYTSPNYEGNEHEFWLNTSNALLITDVQNENLVALLKKEF